MAKNFEDVFDKIMDQFEVKVGVFVSDSKNTREDELTNAKIGYWHEYGIDDLPERSFLRATFENNSIFENDSFKVLKRKTDMTDKESVLKFLEGVSTVAETMVKKSFETGGNGKWPPSDFSEKKNQQTLVETGQLRDSIVGKVTKVGEDD